MHLQIYRHRHRTGASLIGDPIPRFGDRRAIRIGLLGGSFNPAHEGHRHVADFSRARLGLHQVWLLVSPGNPLKPGRGMASLAERLASAGKISDGRRIIATTIETTLNTRFTVDTVRILRQRFPRARFVWLMGADNLAQLPRWRHWQKLVALLPFAVMPRPTYNPRALAGRAAQNLRACRQPARAGNILALQSAPAWLFLPVPQNHASATAIRNQIYGESR